jgi:hypothetical protein
MDRQGWQRPVGGRGHGRGAGAEPSVGDGRAGQDHQEWRRLATRGGRSPIGLWPRHGRGTSANVALLSALAAFAVPAPFGVAQALPAVESESASPGLGHRGLHGHEPYRLDEGNCRSRRASPSRLVAYLDPWLRAATSPGRAEKLGQPRWRWRRPRRHGARNEGTWTRRCDGRDSEACQRSAPPSQRRAGGCEPCNQPPESKARTHTSEPCLARRPGSPCVGWRRPRRQ